MIEKRIQFGIRNVGQNLWLPSGNSELLGWYRADVTSSIITAGSTVTTWNNLKDNTLYSMQSDGGQPTPTTGSTVNGEPVIDFVKPQSLVTSQQNQGSPREGMMTVITFGVITTVGNGGDSIMSCGNTGGLDFEINANDAAQFNGRFAQNGLGTGLTFGFSGGPYSGNTLMAIDLDFSTNTVRARMNGTEVGSSTNYTTKLGNNNFFKMMTNFNGNRRLGGQMGEMITAVFANGYTDSEDFIEKAEGYLAYKFGVQSLLPGLHPYKTQPPRE